MFILEFLYFTLRELPTEMLTVCYCESFVVYQEKWRCFPRQLKTCAIIPVTGSVTFRAYTYFLLQAKAAICTIAAFNAQRKKNVQDSNQEHQDEEQVRYPLSLPLSSYPVPATEGGGG